MRYIKCLLFLAFTTCLLHAESKDLYVTKRRIIVDGKMAEVYDVREGDGTWGLKAEKGKPLHVILHNQTEKAITVHPHGVVLPNPQDGVPGITQIPVPPGETFVYDFVPSQSGTFFAHSHVFFQIQEMLAAPLILLDPDEANKADSDITMLLSDFSFRKPGQIWKDLLEGKNKTGQGKQAASMKGMKMESTADLNDVQYDAYLANYHTLEEPESYVVKPGSTVRLRIIDGSAASNFFVSTGSLKGTLIAVDGSDIEPVMDSTFEIAVAQRLDVLIKIPDGEGVYPILAQCEGTDMRTGIVLHTPGAKTSGMSSKAAKAVGAIGLGYVQEKRLKPLHPLDKKPLSRSLPVKLTGSMQGYRWMINDKQYPATAPLMVKEGDRVELVFENDTAMSHPMHLHGHVFQVTEIDGMPLDGAMRDTVLVMPHSTVKVQFDANNPGLWMLHCHILYHEKGGMMTTLNYEGYPLPPYYRKFDD